jgi:enhancing lycopene biosynthesis protein 2
VEAARLARGDIIDLATANPDDYDALIIPGGFGAAKNLSDFAVNGADASVNPDLKSFAQAIHKAGKPVGLICIAPAMTPLIFGEGAVCTIGNDHDTACAIEAMGGTHQNCSVSEIVIDQERNIITTPAYMLAGSITEAASGINKLVDEVLQRTQKAATV